MTLKRLAGLFSRPKKRESEYFLQPKRDKFSGLTRKAKRRKMANEEDDDDHGAVNASIRSAKKAQRPVKIGMPENKLTKVKKSKPKPKRASGGKPSGGFDQDMGQRSKGFAQEGTRAKKGDTVGRVGKKKGKKTK